MYTTNNSHLTVIGVHEMHGRMYPNYCQITILLVVDLCSSLAYFMMTHPLPIAGKLPIKTSVARQLPTNDNIKFYLSAKSSWLRAAMRGRRVSKVCWMRGLRLFLFFRTSLHTSSKFLIMNWRQTRLGLLLISTLLPPA